MSIKDQRDKIIDKARNSHAYKDEKIKLLSAENAELKATIEKMKCCENCYHGKASGYTCPRDCGCTFGHVKKLPGWRAI